MSPIRLGFVALTLTTAVGSSLNGAPERASETPNLNGISDDNAALSMTPSPRAHSAQPFGVPRRG